MWLPAAIEKQKLVYVLNRDAAAKLTISSPLEAHQGHTVCYSVVGLDVGFSNPQVVLHSLLIVRSLLTPSPSALPAYDQFSFF